jgi:hypothetical protein
MSQSADKTSDEPLVQPSKFGRRLGIAMAIAFIVLALLAGIGWYAHDGSSSPSQPVPSNPTF